MGKELEDQETIEERDSFRKHAQGGSGKIHLGDKDPRTKHPEDLEAAEQGAYAIDEAQVDDLSMK